MAETPEEVADVVLPCAANCDGRAYHVEGCIHRERPGLYALVASALRAQYVAGLEAALAVVDEEDEGPSGYDWQLGDVSDFRKRCTKAIRRLAEQAKREG